MKEYQIQIRVTAPDILTPKEVMEDIEDSITIVAPSISVEEICVIDAPKKESR